MLIALCGMDGSGKTTQGRLLYNYYKKQNNLVYFEKQHTNSYYASSDMTTYLHCENIATKSKIVELALFSAYDRFKHYNQKIKPLLLDGAIVILDRYVYSTYAYFMARGIELQWLLQINRLLPLPDLTICIDVSIEEALKRINSREYFSVEEKDEVFLKHVRDAYVSQLWGKSDSYFVINGMDTPERVFKNILEKVKLFLDK